jgi:uncharacterized protein YjbI with pentapeptide repeats
MEHPPTPQKSSFSPLTIRNLIPGIVVGILIGIAGFLVYERNLPQVTRTLYIVTLTSFGVLVISFVLLYAFKKQITSFIFGSATANAGEVIEDAQRVTDALTVRFADTLLRDVDSGVRDRVRHVLPRLANWFIWSRFRNWWWQWVLGIFVSLGGLTGTLLLMNQNKLLEEQNIKIESQTKLMNQQMLLSEASRRSALVVLMSNIMDKVDKEIERQQEVLSFEQKEKRKYQLSQSLIGQIAALSHSFKPYRYMEGDSLIESPLSPERGQLLITLTLLPLDTFTLKKIYQSATFESADLQNAVLSGAHLRGANLSKANLSKADLKKANLSLSNLSLAYLRGAYLSEADLSRTDLSEADLQFTFLIKVNLSLANLGGAYLSDAVLEGANLTDAKLGGAKLRGANLLKVDLTKADLRDADLRDASLRDAVLVAAILERADLSRADLSRANLGGARLGGTNLRNTNLGDANLQWANLGNANLWGTNLSGAKVTVNQLSESKSLFECKNLHDSLRIPLQKSHPHLFQEQK